MHVRTPIARSAVCLLLVAAAWGRWVNADSVRPARCTVPMVVTAYSDDPESTNWRLDHRGVPVVARGPRAGQPKPVGTCADGSHARLGTLAADTRHYPFGTVMYVPGYGFGVVHDRGADIRGPHRVDVFFPSPGRARQWGRQALSVQISPPELSLSGD